MNTNQIAREAGISPGNLYYWFPSKAEIVRALYADWSARLSIPDTTDADPDDVLRVLWQRVTELAQPDADYAFFLRDLFPLLHADPVLAEAYRHVHVSRRDTLTVLSERLITAGLLRAPEPPTTVQDVVSMLWLVAETAHPFADTVGDEIVDARRYGRAIVQPLLTAEGRRVLGIPERTSDE